MFLLAFWYDNLLEKTNDIRDQIGMIIRSFNHSSSVFSVQDHGNLEPVSEIQYISDGISFYALTNINNFNRT